ncbi:hypothetical protein ACB094_09G158000 [Castanea mollissima]
MRERERERESINYIYTLEEASWKLPWLLHPHSHLTPLPSSFFPSKPHFFFFFLSFSLHFLSLSIMKLPKSLKLSPKRLFGSKKNRPDVSRHDPLSFGSSTSSTSSSSSSDSCTSLHKPGSGTKIANIGTPKSVLPQESGDWGEISAEKHMELVQAFKLMDRDNDGMVSRKELEALLSRLGAEPLSQEEVTMMLSDVDGEGHGCISVDALLTRVGSACGPAGDTELRETFDFFDTDHDGKITAEELLSVFQTIGDERCTLEDCRRMIDGVDKNGDGFVCFEDFTRMMELQR